MAFSFLRPDLEKDNHRTVCKFTDRPFQAMIAVLLKVACAIPTLCGT